MTNTAHGTGDVTESTPLLQETPINNNNITTNANTIDGSDHSVLEATHHVAYRRKWRVILLLYTFVFVMMLGDTLYPAALIQVLEDIICADKYGDISSGSLSDPDGRCKGHAVQKELALVRGFQQLTPVFAGVLCTVPYTLLADRLGRRRILMLSGAGMASAFAWVLAVCYFRFLPVRWIWLSGAFLFVGGGDPVLSSVAHVMLTDTTERPERAQIFLCLHAADVVAGFFGPAVSAALMEGGHVWTVLVLSAAISFFGAFVITSFIPETLHLSQGAKKAAAAREALTRDGDAASDDLEVESAKSYSSLLAPLRTVLSSNPQAVLLLCIFAPQTTARELFNTIGLQYSSVKFSLSYGRGNVLLSLFQGAQGLFALVLLPFITRVVAVPRGWSPWTRDRCYAVVSIAATTSGLLVIALAPVLWIEIVGLLLISLGSCTNGLLMSLMGGAVRPNQVSAMYSAALMLSIIFRSGTGPIVSALFVAGLELGWKWLGLPFAVMAALIACEFGASLFIRAEKDKSVEHDE